MTEDDLVRIFDRMADMTRAKNPNGNAEIEARAAMYRRIADDAERAIAVLENEDEDDG